jgi:integrase
VLAPAAVSVGLTKEKETKDGKTKTVSWITPQVFRHTCASLLFDNGRNMKQVVGWLDPAFTLKTYVHLLDEGIGDASAFDDLDVSTPVAA